MIYRPKDGPRYVYREQVSQKVIASPCLSEKFPELKALAVDLGHFNPEGVARNSQVKYTPNLDTAKSIFRVDCPNQGCIGGDFDLTKSLAKAIAEHRTTVKAEMCCQGWLSKATIDSVHCHNILRFTLNLTY